MSYSIEQLRALSDDELVAAHDQLAVLTQVGTQYYVDELNRREQERSIAASEALARSSHRLSVTNTWLAGLALVVTIVALFVR